MNTARATTAGHVEWLDAERQLSHAIFIAAGMRCAACAGSIEKAVAALPGVDNVTVNVATHRVNVQFDASRTRLERILAAVDQAGFRALPLAGGAAVAAQRDEKRAAIKRLGVAGLGMMQIMMFTFGLYAAGPNGIATNYEHYFKLIAMLITLPVLFYAGAPILRSAWQNLKMRSLGMDVPVSLALLLAFTASVYNTLRGTGEVYFDSVAMFVFFLLAGRFVEMNARHASLSASDALTQSLPETVARLTAAGATERVPVADIRPGDRLSIPKGAVIPVDATLLSASASIDQSLLSGESVAVNKTAGSELPGGAVNAGGVIQVAALSAIDASVLATIVRLLERAQRDRPPIARAADRVAGWFVLGILLLAVIVAGGWLLVDPSRAFSAVLAVLVVTCPCALSLATPVAMAAATTRLARDGVLVARADAIERLASIDLIVFDKTGTLTQGASAAVRVTDTHRVTADAALAIGAALERGSTHPIAQALLRHADAAVVATDIVETAGLGIEGVVAGCRYRLGRSEFVAALTATQRPGEQQPDYSSASIVLGDSDGWVAAFELTDPVRPAAAAAIAELRNSGLELAIASGDRPAAVQAVAQQLGITAAHGQLSPEQKIATVQTMRAGGRRVLMLGDGINDGPVLAAADVSCAMGQGSSIAQAAADLILVDDSLQGVGRAIKTARRARQVLRQNLTWALLYNVAAIPAAALGYVPPWLAAIGMSLSSLFVVLNAQRLTRR
ncbi:MAG: cation-translocating P-type ATPase [Proteobacteria bacterium]|nr:cation-translocating P-type ATPase [Pseudomonadota bacterium]